MLDNQNQGITLKLSTLFNIAPDQEVQPFVPASFIKQMILEGLTSLDHFRCIKKLQEHLEKETNNSPQGSTVIKSPPSPCKSLTRGTYVTRHLAFGQKRNFSFLLGCNVRLTHQGIKKVASACRPRNPVRLLGMLSLVVSSGCLGSCVYQSTG